MGHHLEADLDHGAVYLAHLHASDLTPASRRPKVMTVPRQQAPMSVVDHDLHVAVCGASQRGAMAVEAVCLRRERPATSPIPFDGAVQSEHQQAAPEANNASFGRVFYCPVTPADETPAGLLCNLTVITQRQLEQLRAALRSAARY